jgi:hypothetical protein
MSEQGYRTYERSSFDESGAYRASILSREKKNEVTPLNLSVPEEVTVASARSLSVNENDYRSWISEHSRLALKLVTGEITRTERMELTLLRWMLDTAEENAPDPLGILNDLVSERERLAREISSFVKTTKDLTTRVKRR